MVSDVSVRCSDTDVSSSQGRIRPPEAKCGSSDGLFLVVQPQIVNPCWTELGAVTN